MKKFVKKLICGILIIAVTFGLIVGFDAAVIGNIYEDGFEASLLDKLARLESINEPKIVLVGNSNLAFGIDSEMLGEAFDMPVVNLGLIGGLGNRAHEQMIYGHVGVGDIVIVCHTSYSDDGRIMDPQTVWKALEYHRNLWQLIAKEDMPKMLLYMPTYIYGAALKWITHTTMADYDSAYKRSAFNEYGDVAVRPSAEQYHFGDRAPEPPPINDICTNRLNDLNAYVESCGAKMYVAAYPVGYENTEPDEQLYTDFENELQEALDCRVISHWADYFFATEYIYDTAYHLTLEGASLRTAQLIEDMEGAGK